jgi:hypothetical protein
MAGRAQPSWLPAAGARLQTFSRSPMPGSYALLASANGVKCRQSQRSGAAVRIPGRDLVKVAPARTEAELKALFEQAVRAIGFYEAQRKEVLMALESLRRALNAPQAEAADAAATTRGRSERPLPCR